MTREHLLEALRERPHSVDELCERFYSSRAEVRSLCATLIFVDGIITCKLRDGEPVLVAEPPSDAFMEYRKAES